MGSNYRRYAWIVLLACFFISLIIDGFLYSFGAVSHYFKDYYRCKEWEISLIISLATGFYWISAPISSLLCLKLNCRSVAILGSLLAFAGIFLSTYSTRIVIVWFCYGIIGGFGLGLTYMTTFIVIEQYFDDKHALATGISTAGSGFGSILFAPFANGLFNYFGWIIGLRICACLILVCALFSCLFVPLKKDKTISIQDEKQNSSKEDLEQNLNQNEDQHLKNSTENEQEELKKNHFSCEQTNDSTEINRQAFWKEMNFILICFANIPIVFGYLCPYLFLVSMSINDRKITESSSVYFLSILGVSNTLFRFLSGLISKLPKLSPSFLHNLGLFMGGLSSLFIPLCRTYSSLAVYSIIWGSFTAFFISMSPVIVRQYIRSDKYGQALGLIFLCRGLTSLIAPPILALIRDLTSSFTLTFILAGISLIIGGIFHIPLKKN